MSEKEDTRPKTLTYYDTADVSKMSPEQQKAFYEAKARYDAKNAQLHVMSVANQYYHSGMLTEEGKTIVKDWETTEQKNIQDYLNKEEFVTYQRQPLSDEQLASVGITAHGTPIYSVTRTPAPYRGLSDEQLASVGIVAHGTPISSVTIIPRSPSKTATAPYTPPSTSPSKTSLTPYEVAETAQYYGIPQGDYAKTEAAVVKASEQSAEQTKQKSALQSINVLVGRVEFGQTSPQAAYNFLTQEGPTFTNPLTQMKATETVAGLVSGEIAYNPEKAESKEFYESIGYEQFGGKYAPFDIPDKYSVQNITETPEGLTITFQEPNSFEAKDETKRLPFPVGPTQFLTQRMTEEMGPSPKSITEVFRGIRNTFFDAVTPDAFKKSETAMSNVLVATSPFGKVTASTLITSQQTRSAVDVPIGFVKGAESLVNPNIKSYWDAFSEQGREAYAGQDRAGDRV